jgi:hypothetical protein
MFPCILKYWIFYDPFSVYVLKINLMFYQKEIKLKICLIKKIEFYVLFIQINFYIGDCCLKANCSKIQTPDKSTVENNIK